MFTRLRRFASAHPLVVDSVFAIVLAVFIGLGVWHITNGSTARHVGGALFVAAALSLAVRRRNPFLCVALTFAFTIAAYVTAVPFPPAVLPAAVALYSVGSVAGGRRVVAVAVAVLAISIGLAFVSKNDEGIVQSLIFEVAWVVGALALGIAVANRRAYTQQLRQRAIEAERTKEEEAQRRVGEERMRIARDVHDGVAHALASISIQASAGSTVLDRDPEAARDAFAAIRTASGAALAELRSTLGLLRHDDGSRNIEGLDREQVEQMVAVLRSEGIRVRLRGESSSWALEGEAGEALHRILQESLTNVLRHSGASEVVVAIDRDEKGVTLTVTDNGKGVVPAASETRGYGLVGMRERASLIGGSVESGPRKEGGFQVQAAIPLGDGS